MEEYTEQKEDQKIKHSNRSFMVMNFLIICFSLVAIVLSVLNYNCEWFTLTKSCINLIELSCQIVSAVICSVLSILGISFSLQDNEFLGIPFGHLYQMRQQNKKYKHYYSLKCSIIISLSLITVSILGLLINQFILTITMTVLLIIFMIFLVITELPYLSFKENLITGIFKERYISEYNEEISPDSYQEKEFIEDLSSLICSKNLRWVYDRMKIDNKKDYNIKLLKFLLDIQWKIASHLDLIESKKELTRVTDEMLGTVCDITCSYFNIIEILGNNINGYSHYLTSVIFKLLGNTVSKEKTEKRLAEMTVTLPLPSLEEEKVKGDLFFSVLTIILTEKIKKDDFSLLNELAKKYSVNQYLFRESGLSTRIFLMISFIMYYIAEVESAFPEDTKKGIREFIISEGIEDHVKKLSWKNLFADCIYSISVPLKDFICDFSKNKHYYEYSLYGVVYTSVLTDELATDWYLANMFSGKTWLFGRGYEKQLHISEDDELLKHHMHNLRKELYPDEKNFIPSERFKKMSSFYLDSEADYSSFKFEENESYRFRDYIDSFKIKEMEEKIKQNSSVSEKDVIKNNQDFLLIINEHLNNSFGFSSDIDLSDEKEFVYTLVYDKQPESYYFNFSMREFFFRNFKDKITIELLNDKTKIIQTGPDFDDGIKAILNEEIAFATRDVYYYSVKISDSKIREQFEEKIKPFSSKDSYDKNLFFDKPAIVLKDGFSFNCKVRFEAVALSQEIIQQRADNYRRSDGQYVYQGAFCTREKILEFIEQTQIMYRLVFSYKFMIDKEKIIVLEMKS